MHIGSYFLPNNIFVAPMVGVTDRPFRQLCKKLGAGYAVSEMTTSNPQLWATDKSARRLNHDGELEPIAVQIAGGNTEMLVEAARFNVARGAQIIDINMGCPAKKVCNVAAGSALLRDERLVSEIVSSVVRAVNVPVTLKFRTGWDKEHINALRVAQIAQDAGIQMLTLHGRTRADGYKGDAEYDTIRAVKSAVSIPVVANGDINTPEQASDVLDYTGADAIMIGRAAQGRPWIFREVSAFLETGQHISPPTVLEVKLLLLEHLLDHYSFYGDRVGLLTARKHIGWYVRGLLGGEEFRGKMNLLNTLAEQYQSVTDFFDGLATDHHYLPYL